MPGQPPPSRASSRASFPAFPKYWPLPPGAALCPESPTKGHGAALQHPQTPSSSWTMAAPPVSTPPCCPLCPQEHKCPDHPESPPKSPGRGHALPAFPETHTREVKRGPAPHPVPHAGERTAGAVLRPPHPVFHLRGPAELPGWPLMPRVSSACLPMTACPLSPPQAPVRRCREYAAQTRVWMLRPLPPGSGSGINFPAGLSPLTQTW